MARRQDIFPIENLTENMWRSLKLPQAAGRTYQWYPSDSPDNYRVTSEQLYGTADITYVMNSYGYRSDEFTSDKPSIAFIGCSNTLGMGLPLEETFSWKFTKEVEKELDRPVSYFNLSHGGKGLDYVTRTLFLARRVFRPDYLIAYLPSAARMEIFAPGTTHLRDIITPIDDAIVPKGERAGFARMMSDEEQAMKIIRTVATLETVVDCPYTWSNWNLQPTIEEHYLNFTGGRFECERFSACIKFDQKARDLLHPGAESNDRFFRQLYEEKGQHVIDTLKKRWS